MDDLKYVARWTKPGKGYWVGYSIDCVIRHAEDYGAKEYQLYLIEDGKELKINLKGERIMTVRELLNMNYEEMPDVIDIDGYKFFKTVEHFLDTIYRTEDGFEWTRVNHIMFDDEVTVLKDKPKKLEKKILYSGTRNANDKDTLAMNFDKANKMFGELYDTVNNINEKLYKLEK